MVYAVSLGIAKQVLKNLKLKFPPETFENKDLAMINFLSEHGNILNFKSSLEKIITTSLSSSSSGKGGGFSGGSSGGSGGRGGGGAF